jgi:hypothetical protein
MAPRGAYFVSRGYYVITRFPVIEILPHPALNTRADVNSISLVTLDSPALVLDLQRTDYFTLMSILPSITQNSRLRMKFGSLHPPLNHIPHSFCLHFVVRFSDGNILCMRRHPKASYHKNLWSFSKVC